MATEGKIVLATDLDGTLLGGTAEEKARLYSLLEANRDKLVLVFVTGRQLEGLKAFADLPKADYYICDVGSTVYDSNYKPVADVQSWIDERWPSGSEDAVRAVLKDVEHITPQRLPHLPGRRVSYAYSAGFDEEAVVDLLQRAGYNPIVSHGVFLDVLPRGVAKGPTLLRLLEHLGMSPGETIVAGDTMNDFSLFSLGVHPEPVASERPLLKILVANADREITQAVAGFPDVFRATKNGAAGIEEGLVHLKVAWACKG
ncbi:Glucosylglycerol-phosphate synthase [Diplonema papillatum]|nr:Glucosylglycerol-phosphate synthase [Diplonema papillatum]